MFDMPEQFDDQKTVLLSYDPTTTYTAHRTVTIGVHTTDGDEPPPITLAGSVRYADDGTWLSAQLWNTEDRYIGMLTPVLRDDSTPEHATIVGYTTIIDRITIRHASLNTGLMYLAEHAGLILPGLQALEDALVRASRDERVGLRRLVAGLTHGETATRQRWARHALVLSCQSRLFPDRDTRA